jgi:hypothetical protein
MEKIADLKLAEGQVVRTRDSRVEVVEEASGRVVSSVDHLPDVEVRVDGVVVPRPGKREER